MSERVRENDWRPSRRDLIFGGGMAVTGGIAYARMPHRREMKIRPGQLEKIVPDQIGPWRSEAASGMVLPPPDQLARLLYDQQVSRTYVADDRLPIMFLMAYGSSQGGLLQIHRPEICYPASGFHLAATRESVLSVDGRQLPVRSFTADSVTRVEQLIYWTRIGDALPVSWAGQRLAVMRSNLKGFVPDGLLVRFSTVTQDRDAGMAALEEFIRTMLRAVGPGGRAQLIGAT